MNSPNPSANGNANSACSGEPGCCGGLDRREFLKFMGVSAVGALLAQAPVMAGPFQAADFKGVAPTDKKLHPDWVKALYARGERAVYQGEALEKIGMPIGGICAGQVYLGGDGKLWHWDIFNSGVRTDSAGSHYANPMTPKSPFEQGFAVQVRAGDRTVVKTLDRRGFPGVSFCGEYPIGNVEYKDPEVPVEIALEAFSPFIPLATDDSSHPATVLRYTVKNASAAPAEVTLAGWLQNPVCLFSGRPGEGERINRIRRGDLTLLECAAQPSKEKAKPAPRAPEVFAGFEGADWDEWSAEGQAFGEAPAKGSRPGQTLSGFEGKGLVDTWTGSDKLQGKLISPTFIIRRPWINFLIGGGNHPKRTCINLIVDGAAARTAEGRDSDAMEWAAWDVRELEGKMAHFEIVDAASGPWGHVAIDQIEFADAARTVTPLSWRHDHGSMALALLGGKADDLAAARLEGAEPIKTLFGGLDKTQREAKAPFTAEKLMGAVGRKLTLAPGAEETVTFIIAWHFPNWTLKSLTDVGGRYYGTKFKNAADVAGRLARDFDKLYAQTKLWHETWYDSTLPRWFLDRLHLNISILATATCYRLASGRFWAWEGVGCCHGTCGHVWQYAHSVARLFPELERDTRERVDFGLSFNPDSGVIGFRGEFDMGLAIDAQAGTILRVYREHQMSTNSDFLRRVWPRVRKAFDPLLARDPDRDGILEGDQMNTLDRPWFGKIAWLSSMYVAALRAGEAMAREVGDEEFARTCAAIAERGRKAIDSQLFNGEYYYQIPDPERLDQVGSFDGCEMDQVMGQSWAHQVGLGPILDPAKVQTALRSLYKYNFTPDVGPFREAHKEGRWYAMAGEGGLINCSWPRGEAARQTGRFDYYFNEGWTGTEYQVAGHMLWEGLVQEALAIVRAAHDRHHPTRRNPYNEIECGDHYARAMSSHGVFLAACGYEYHGPNGRLAFAPRLGAEDFRAPFTTAEGWGTFSQKAEGAAMRAALELKWGKLRLKSFGLTLPEGMKPQAVRASAAGRDLQVRHELKDRRLTLTLPEVRLHAGDKLEVTIA